MMGWSERHFRTSFKSLATTFSLAICDVTVKNHHDFLNCRQQQASTSNLLLINAHFVSWNFCCRNPFQALRALNSASTFIQPTHPITVSLQNWHPFKKTVRRSSRKCIMLLINTPFRLKLISCPIIKFFPLFFNYISEISTTCERFVSHQQLKSADNLSGS